MGSRYQPCFGSVPDKNGIEIETGTEKADFNNAVFCTGHRPLLPKVTAENIDLQNTDWIYIIGDATGKCMAADAAMEEGSQVASRILYQNEREEVKTAKCILHLFRLLLQGFVPRGSQRELLWNGSARGSNGQQYGGRFCQSCHG